MPSKRCGKAAICRRAPFKETYRPPGRVCRFLQRYRQRLSSCTSSNSLQNMFESNHRVIRSIYPRLLHVNAALARRLASHQSLRISNYLYGPYVPSAYGLTKSFFRTFSSLLSALPAEPFQSQVTLSSRSKLALILQRKPTHDIPL